MIGSRQIPPKMTRGTSGGGLPPPIALFQQLWQPIAVNGWLSPWVIFSAGSLTACYGWCNTGTFTADVYIDGVKSFTVTQAAFPTPVDLLPTKDGLLAAPSVITCQITAMTGTVDGLFIKCT